MTYGHGWSLQAIAALRSAPRRAIGAAPQDDWRELGPESRWALVEQALGTQSRAA